MFGESIGMHVLAVEYPGYGLYQTSKASEEKIKEDAICVYDYLTTCVGLRESDIILFGRSLGSGPTSYLSSIRSPYALLLMSGYRSIQEVVKSILRWGSILSLMAIDHFRNIDRIK